MSHPPSPKLIITIFRNKHRHLKLILFRTVFICSCMILFLSLVILHSDLNAVAFKKKNQQLLQKAIASNPENKRKVKFVSKYKGTFSSTNISDVIAWNPSILESIREEPKCIKNSLLAILITSAPDHHEQRKEIRNTWCARNLGSMLYRSGYVADVHCVFLIGRSGLESVDHIIAIEIARYRDILWAGYVDVYRNLTLKVLTGLNWIANRCSSKFVLKTDDDCFVNTFILPQVLAGNSDLSSSHMYTGYLYNTPKETKVIRSESNKWYVSMDELLPDYYPPYISGTGYILSSYSLRVIMELARTYKPFPNEDAYVGMLVERAGFEPKACYRFVLSVFKWTTCNFLYLVVVHSIKPSQMINLRDQVFKATIICHEKINTVL